MSGTNNGNALWIGGGVSLLVIAAVLWSAREDARKDYESSRPDVGAVSAAGGGWQTRSITDPMGGAGGKIVCTVSTNSLVLPWPYGDIRAELCFRRTERQGFDAMLQVQPDAVVVCHPGRCPITVRVDDGAMRSYDGRDTLGGSSNLVFFENPSRLQRALASSKLVRMELTLLDYGPVVFVFSTANLPPI